MLDVRKPLGLLFLILGGLLFFYGVFFSPGVEFHTPGTAFLLKLNQPVGAFMFAFGLIMWQLARFVEISTLDRELTRRENELGSEDHEKDVETPEEGESAGSFPRVSEDVVIDAAATETASTDETASDSRLDITQQKVDEAPTGTRAGESTATDLTKDAAEQAPTATDLRNSTAEEVSTESKTDAEPSPTEEKSVPETDLSDKEKKEDAPDKRE